MLGLASCSIFVGSQTSTVPAPSLKSPASSTFPSSARWEESLLLLIVSSSGFSRGASSLDTLTDSLFSVLSSNTESFLLTTLFSFDFTVPDLNVMMGVAGLGLSTGAGVSFLCLFFNRADRLRYHPSYSVNVLLFSLFSLSFVPIFSLLVPFLMERMGVVVLRIKDLYQPTTRQQQQLTL